MIQVTFTATVKTIPHQTLLNAVREAAQSIEGFISIDSEYLLQDGINLEKTISLWRDKTALLAWVNHPLHQVVKYRANYYYVDYQVEQQLERS